MICLMTVRLGRIVISAGFDGYLVVENGADIVPYNENHLDLAEIPQIR